MITFGSEPVADMSEAIDRIRSTSPEQLRDPEWLEHRLLPPLGLSPLWTEHYPEHLRHYCGKGLLSFQMPAQFARYLAYLSYFPIRSYVEIGVFHGGTFIITVEYLSRFQPIARALAMDISITEQMRAYAARNPAVTLHEGDSRAPEARALLASERWDLALIDGDHSEAGCQADYESLRDRTRLIAFHDTYNDVCPEVGIVWQRIRASLPRRCLREFHEQYPEISAHVIARCMGIGLVDFSALAPTP